jgi:hypothetical protein
MLCTAGICEKQLFLEQISVALWHLIPGRAAFLDGKAAFAPTHSLVSKEIRSNGKAASVVLPSPHFL